MVDECCIVCELKVTVRSGLKATGSLGATGGVKATGVGVRPNSLLKHFKQMLFREKGITTTSELSTYLIFSFLISLSSGHHSTLQHIWSQLLQSLEVIFVQTCVNMFLSSLESLHMDMVSLILCMINLMLCQGTYSLVVSILLSC